MWANASVCQLLGLDTSACYDSSTPLHQSRFCVPPPPIQLKDFVCQWCSNVLDQPVETKCRHVMCKLCICRHLLQSPNSKPSCPVCSKEFIGLSEVRTLSSGLLRILSKLEIHCDHLECKVTVPLDKLQEHVTRCSPAHASRVLVVSSPCESPQSTPGPSNQSTPRSEQSHLSPQTSLTQSTPRPEPVVDDSEVIAEKYRKLFSLFAKCHNLYSTAAVINDNSISQLGV